MCIIKACQQRQGRSVKVKWVHLSQQLVVEYKTNQNHKLTSRGTPYSLSRSLFYICIYSLCIYVCIYIANRFPSLLNSAASRNQHTHEGTRSAVCEKERVKGQYFCFIFSEQCRGFKFWHYDPVFRQNWDNFGLLGMQMRGVVLQQGPDFSLCSFTW